MRHLLMLCLAVATAGALADTYRWTDEAGRTVISDTPPVGRARDVQRKSVGSEAGDSLPFATRKAAEACPVTLYTAADCVSECKQARDLLNGRGVPFSEKMVQNPEDARELKQLVGDAFVPALKVGKQHVRGYDAGAYDNLLDLAGYPKSAPYGAKPSGGLSQ